MKYDPKEIEKKWIEVWEKEKTYVTPKRSNRPKSYVLGMFPYPSGEGLHTGHGRIFTAVDVIGRYQRMKGYDVLMPMGWDSFGLPAENAAIKAKKNPMDMVPHNEANFKRQMMMLGWSYDWEREFSTTDPAYYKWTQWLFLKLYSIKNDKGERLIYRKEVPINWCPFCKTGLANEEVQADGTHERCGTAVTQKLLPQWNMRITDYADRLLTDLDSKELDWPKGILEMQKNWIGKKEGININYPVVGTDEIVTCFTTAPVNFGMSFIVLAPEHKLVKKILSGDVRVDERQKQEVGGYVSESRKKSEADRMKEGREKSGVFTGLMAKNVVTDRDVPIWIADFVLGHVGTGAVQGCPGHDYKDFEFAVKFGLPVKRVVVGPDGDIGPVDSKEKVIVKGMKGKMINSEFLDGLEFGEGLQRTMDYVEEKGWGKRVTSWHLRDWVFSRQRYWGEPFPLVYCSKCGDENGVVPLPEDQLPLTLPYLESYEPTDTGQSPLSRIKEWVETTCPNCGGPARRETDTMPNWAGSCWYFLYFAKKLKTEKTQKLKTSENKKMNETWEEEMISGIKDWLPVDWYLGGAEHAVLHLLYARFWTKAFKDLGLINFSEPFLRLRSVGMVLAADGKKMSKSLGNVVNPDEVVAKYGADAVRIYELFMGPWGQAISWSERSLIGCRRFVEKVWSLAQRDIENKWKTSDQKLVMELNRVIAKVGEDIVALKFNTAVAALMKFANFWSDCKTGLSKDDLSRLLLVVAPLMPFMAEELWQRLGGEVLVHTQKWPMAEKIIEKEVTMVVQVEGKTRGVIRTQELKNSKTQEKMEELALADPKIGKYVEGKKYKVIFVPGKIINFVLTGD
ncbi:leucine--tRNA ligase [Candidatus Collierbacteria bacterium]|nr:leucine--tRNA ligase [Candidatus Collierbacteria bacterium]